MKHQPNPEADRGGQRDKSRADEDRRIGEQQPQMPPEPVNPHRDSGANANPQPGVDERRNRSI